jgi:hypothetical protein
MGRRGDSAAGHRCLGHCWNHLGYCLIVYGRFDVSEAPVKKLALTVMLLASTAAYAADEELLPAAAPPPARVTVAPQIYGPPPIGWVYGPYTQCADPPRCSMGMVNVQADGLNVRVAPNGPPIMSLVNGTLLVPLRQEGDWMLVAAGCDLTPTFAWSWTAGVPLNRCWVYF